MVAGTVFEKAGTGGEVFFRGEGLFGLEFHDRSLIKNNAYL